jgi:hypothetical protein
VIKAQNCEMLSLMPEPAILTTLRSRPDPDYREFVHHYDRFKFLVSRQHGTGLCQAELSELLLLRESDIRRLIRPLTIIGQSVKLRSCILIRSPAIAPLRSALYSVVPAIA